jgi:O-antigen/teichoic acid export membrane protein
MAGIRVLGFVTAFLANIVLSRWLGSSGRGQYGIYVTAIFLLSVPFGLGLGTANTIIVGKKPETRYPLAANSLLYGTIATLPIIFLPILLPNLPLWQLVSLPPYYWSLTGIGLWLTLLFSSILGIILGQQNYRIFNFINGFQALTGLIILSVALILLKKGILGAIFSNLLALFIVLIVLLFLFLYKRRTVDQPFALNRTLFDESIKIGFRGTVINTFDSLHFRMDIILVGLWLGTSQAGIYTQATVLTSALSFFPPLINNLIFSHVPSSGSRDAKLILQIAHFLSLITVASLVFVFLTGRFLLEFLFTKEFLPAYWPWVILFAAEIFKAHTAVTAGFLAGLGYPRIYTIGAISGFLCNVCINFFFIPYLGTIGAALASLISYSLLSVIYMFGLIWHANLNLADTIPSLAYFREAIYLLRTK